MNTFECFIVGSGPARERERWENKGRREGGRKGKIEERKREGGRTEEGEKEREEGKRGRER